VIPCLTCRTISSNSSTRSSRFLPCSSLRRGG
jgi:hypothetical protein